MKARTICLVHHKGQERRLAHSELHILLNKQEVRWLGAPAPLGPADGNRVPVNTGGFCEGSVGCEPQQSAQPHLLSSSPATRRRRALSQKAHRHSMASLLSEILSSVTKAGTSQMSWSSLVQEGCVAFTSHPCLTLNSWKFQGRLGPCVSDLSGT